MTQAIDWEMAERVAIKVSGREPFAQSYHWDSLGPDFEEFTAKAEELVAEETGLRSLAGPARGRLADRPDWVRANIASFQRLLRPVLTKFEDRLTASPAAPFASKMAGAEIGMLLGWMSGRVLGQYDLLIVEEENPADQDIVYYVGPNVLAIEKMFAFPPREFRLWLALHEVTHRAQFTGVPWMRDHFLGLVSQTMEAVDPDPKRLIEALMRVLDAMRNGTNPLEDGGIMAVFAGEEQRKVMEQVSGLMSLLEGHGDITMDRAGKGLVPNADRFSRALKQRRQNATPLAKFVQQFVGLEAKINQYEQGEKFIEAIEREGGERIIDEAWVTPANLPSIAEIRNPDLWLARVRPAAA